MEWHTRQLRLTAWRSTRMIFQCRDRFPTFCRLPEEDFEPFVSASILDGNGIHREARPARLDVHSERTQRDSPDDHRRRLWLGPNMGRRGRRHHPICHSFLTDGKWEYEDDSTHDMAGQTVDVPDARSRHELPDNVMAGTCIRTTTGRSDGRHDLRCMDRRWRDSVCRRYHRAARTAVPHGGEPSRGRAGAA